MNVLIETVRTAELVKKNYYKTEFNKYPFLFLQQSKLVLLNLSIVEKTIDPIRIVELQT